MEITNTELSPPQILSYRSSCLFLKDYFLFRKKADLHFSYEIWSAELSFKTRTYLKLLVDGQRNITSEFIEVLSKKLKFSDREKLHFSILAQIDANKMEKMDDALKDMFYETFSTDHQRKVIEEKEFITSLMAPLVQLLAASEDFIVTEESVQKILRVSLIEVKQTLSLLQNLDLIQYDEKRQAWVSKANAFDIKKNSADLKTFHQKSLQEALDKLDQEIDFKKNRSIYFSIESSKLGELSIDIENFLRKIRNKYSKDQKMKDKQLVKVNLQGYSLSSRVEEV